MKNAKGFTLLEVLISLTILSLIAVILFGSLRLGTDSVRRGNKRVEETESLRGLYLNLSEQFSSLLPLVVTEEGERKVLFDADRDSLRFMSRYSMFSKGDSFVEVSYSIVDTEEGLSLLLTERLPGENEGISSTLITGVQEMGFSYLSEEDWVSGWDNTQDYPLSVALYIKKEGRAVEMVFPILVEGIQKSSSQRRILKR